jgi:hypothetical protein
LEGSGGIVDFQPGDMIGFSDCSLASLSVRLCTGGICGGGLSHCGVVVKYPDYPRLLLFESAPRCSLPCIFAGKPVSGVQAHYLHERIARYRGAVWHYPLAKPFASIGHLCRGCEQMLGLPYDWFGAWLARRTLLRRLTRHWFRSRSQGRMFCSEFVARAWLRGGGIELPLDLAPTQLVRQAIERGVLRQPQRAMFSHVGRKT